MGIQCEVLKVNKYLLASKVKTFLRNINNGLQNLLNADYVRLSFVPAITPNPDELGMTMGLTVKF